MRSKLEKDILVHWLQDAKNKGQGLTVVCVVSSLTLQMLDLLLGCCKNSYVTRLLPSCIAVGKGYG